MYQLDGLEGGGDGGVELAVVCEGDDLFLGGGDHEAAGVGDFLFEGREGAEGAGAGEAPAVEEGVPFLGGGAEEEVCCVVKDLSVWKDFGCG